MSKKPLAVNPNSFNPQTEAPHVPWERDSYYAVMVSWFPGNPWHPSILYTGLMFECENTPGNYSGIFNPSYDPEYRSFGYLNKDLRIKVLHKLNMPKDEYDLYYYHRAER